MTISHCPICGFPFGQPLEEHEVRKSYDICECCGCEYGVDDTPSYRTQWLASGAPWFHVSSRPGDWDLQAQLQHAIPEWNGLRS